MKKAIILMLLLLTGCGITGLNIAELIPQEPQIKHCSPNITIASFNIRKFSDNSRTDEEIKQIAAVLSEFDLIAVQEVLGNPIILNRTIQMLPGYNYIVSEEVGNMQKERYAFIFNEKIKVISEGKTYYDKYDKFIREPYYASFKSGGFDFTILTVHILYGDSAKDRTGEMKQIASVYEYYQEKDDSENDLILTGDFNTQPTHYNFDYIKEIPGITLAIQEGKSTIGKTGNLYDNIIFDSNTEEYTGLSRIHYFDTGMDMDAAKQAISDHRPVYAVFCTGMDDD
ncbi:endonuclease/exonuclease/phosphatase family protein [Candidatus Woesearchaeota archaeon]|nr:endonuclease/exonuclease/phosphatase family protein [Candidatus Woesearchaeota archaeon]MBW3005899.1 endonuclease/exonuclease/phosphatase family protein [Candidatus Woesearchaeota archaeon]